MFIGLISDFRKKHKNQFVLICLVVNLLIGLLCWTRIARSANFNKFRKGLLPIMKCYKQEWSQLHLQFVLKLLFSSALIEICPQCVEIDLLCFPLTQLLHAKTIDMYRAVNWTCVASKHKQKTPLFIGLWPPVREEESLQWSCLHSYNGAIMYLQKGIKRVR